MAPVPERCVLLVVDGWHALRDGIYGTNRSLALSLSRFQGVRVYCALLSSLNNLTTDNLNDAETNNITLIGTEVAPPAGKSLHQTFNDSPLAVFPNIFNQVPGVTHIIGHSPVTAEGAVKLRDSLYSESKVLLFYHILPDDVSWLAKDVPYVMPTDADLVKLAEKADVVYSVTKKLHWHFRAKFRNRASKNIDHRLFLPQAMKEVFDVVRKPARKAGAVASPVVFALSFGSPSDWQGLDIVACAVNKVALAMMDRSKAAGSPPVPKLVIGNVRTSNTEAVKRYVKPYVTVATVDVEYRHYSTVADLKQDLAESTLALLPCRAEPYGNLALSLLSSGIPCLMADSCAVASLIKHLTAEPESVLAPVTACSAAVRQDASVWRDRILAVLDDLEGANSRSQQLRTALKRDEATKVTHDNVVCYCLGGIKLHHQVATISFKIEEDAELELPVLRALNRLVSETLRQCWRFKHHPLTGEDDLQDLLQGAAIPLDELLRHVTNRIEERDRRIVGLDAASGAFVVYCPTPHALSDLWALCDVINSGLVRALFSSSGGCSADVLGHFGVKDAHVVTAISGPEFLAYKKELLRSARPKTAAF